jgi:hypothetical protein
MEQYVSTLRGIKDLAAKFNPFNFSFFPPEWVEFDNVITYKVACQNENNLPAFQAVEEFYRKHILVLSDKLLIHEFNRMREFSILQAFYSSDLCLYNLLISRPGGFLDFEKFRHDGMSDEKTSQLLLSQASNRPYMYVVDFKNLIKYTEKLKRVI